MSLLVPDTGLLFWMTLSFGIVLLVLVRYAFPVITKAVDARNEYIQSSLEEARKAKEALSAAENEASHIREEARRDYAELIAKAGDQKNRILTEARQEAEKEIALIKEKAHREIEKYRLQAITQAGEEIVNLSAQIAQKALGQTLDSLPKQKELISQLLKEELQKKNN